ncbi:MAG: diguanylate cyclase [Candidatus Aminicenantes bacterium RBG_13_63_10]|nr:MAG: diguanylate cyclase [Candidatus Aminicenantes bacterium RBG_13_63_10]
MSDHSWIKEFPGAITVCDERGKILAMNEQAFETFAEFGGAALVGRNVLDCHPEPARTKLDGMLRAGRTNVYTILKKGKKKLVYQSPWYENGQYAGFVEMVLVIPEAMPHFDRDARA